MSSGGKGSSQSKTQSQTSTQTETSTVNTVDNRIVDGNDARIGGNVSVNSGDNHSGTINVSTTDQGAVQAGLDLALESLGFASSTQAGIKSVAADSISQAYDLAQEARQSETSGAINKFAKYAAIIAVIGIVAYAFTRSKYSK